MREPLRTVRARFNVHGKFPVIVTWGHLSSWLSDTALCEDNENLLGGKFGRLQLLEWMAREEDEAAAQQAAAIHPEPKRRPETASRQEPLKKKVRFLDPTKDGLGLREIWSCFEKPGGASSSQVGSEVAVYASNEDQTALAKSLEEASRPDGEDDRPHTPEVGKLLWTSRGLNRYGEQGQVFVKDGRRIAQQSKRTAQYFTIYSKTNVNNSEGTRTHPTHTTENSSHRSIKQRKTMILYSRLWPFAVARRNITPH